MAKKTKDTTDSKKKKDVKVTAPPDPVKTKNLVRLLNILALVLAITAFVLQLFAVLSHHWKWQTTDVHSIISPTYHYSQPHVYEDSRLEQHYGLYSREVKLYANNDEQLDVWGSTRFPRVNDDNESNFHQCITQTASLRGAALTCSDRVISPAYCNCRRYTYWNIVIVFEIVALILLGIVVVLTALLTTHLHGVLKPAAAGLALLAFILLLVGLILILSYLKRETRSFADAYPHIYQKLTAKLGVDPSKVTANQHYPSALRRAINRRQAAHNPPEHYRAYPLELGQYHYNETHFQEYSHYEHAWIYRPYTDLVTASGNYQPSENIVSPGTYEPRSQQGAEDTTRSTTTTTAAAPVYNQYGPLLGYNNVFDHTRAGIGWSTILSIIAMILALLLALILIFSWLTNKKLGPDTKTVTKTTTTEYVAVPQYDVTVDQKVVRPIPVEYDYNRPIGDAVVTARNVGQGPRDVPITQYVQQPHYTIETTTPRPYNPHYDPRQPIGEAIVSHNIRPGPYDIPVNQPERIVVKDVIIRDESPTKQTTTTTTTTART